MQCYPKSEWPLIFCNEISGVLQEFLRYFPGVFSQNDCSSTQIICFIIAFDLFQLSIVMEAT